MKTYTYEIRDTGIHGGRHIGFSNTREGADRIGKAKGCRQKDCCCGGYQVIALDKKK
jgi:hypothetical protein